MISQSFFIMLLLAYVSASVEVQYLYKNEHNSRIYYVFKCETIAQTIQWEINLFPIGGFNPGQAGTVLTNNRLNLHYSAVLLSSIKTDQASEFNSLLIVYAPVVTNLDIACFNEVESNSTSNYLAFPLFPESNIIKTDNSIFLSHWLSITKDEDQMKNSTNLFLCNVNNDFQSWEVNSDLPFGFSILDNIGDIIPLPKAGQNFINLVAVLSDRTSRSLTTILILNEISSANVTCSSGPNSVTLYATNQKQETETVTEFSTTDAPYLSITNPLLLPTMYITEKADQNHIIDASVGSIIGYVAISISIIIIIIVVVAISAATYYNIRKRKKVPTSEDAIRSEMPSEDTTKLIPSCSPLHQLDNNEVPDNIKKQLDPNQEFRPCEMASPSIIQIQMPSENTIQSEMPSKDTIKLIQSSSSIYQLDQQDENQNSEKSTEEDEFSTHL